MAKKALRRSQAVAPFGVGAIVDFPRQSLMAAGLDVWPDKPECLIHDDRLARRLSVQYFRAPLPGRQGNQTGAEMPFIRFPLWHFCPRCRALYRTAWNEPRPPKCSSPIGLRFKPKPGRNLPPPCSELPERKRWWMVPVRFVVACQNGHIDDFPWVEWAHTPSGASLEKSQVCDSPQLRLNYTGKAGLMGLIVMCENKNCNAKPRSLMGSAGPNSLRGYDCSGNRPWLGPHGKEECNPPRQPRMLQRGATNLYFPKVASSILIPPFSDPLRAVVDDPHHWATLTRGVDENGQPEDGRLEVFAETLKLDFHRLKEIVIQKLTGSGISDASESEEEFRYSEYRALLGPSGSPDDEFVISAQNMNLYEEDIRTYIHDIVLVEKLAETRALAGFSRIDPPPYREFDPTDRSLLSLQPPPWLPAIRVYGEGLFLTLEPAAIDRWTTDEMIERYRSIHENHVRLYKRLDRTPRILSPTFFLIHTLAHALIRRLSYDCGYGSSALRERIYCWDGQDHKMAGLLIYTAAGDCEGTMGGLVQQGKPGRFESLLFSAIQDARWCSSDPLCVESRGQGIDSLNRAACHACTLLPETSCEEGNRFLDRVALVGTPNNPSAAFFDTIVNNLLSGAA